MKKQTIWLIGYNPAAPQAPGYIMLEGEKALQCWLEKREEFGTEVDAPYNIETNEIIAGIRVREGYCLQVNR